ncbi:MAG: hypothetical protein K6U14_03720 [Firmicutes bacterium]|nr:hypothetical protein [Alicyclobacillaceae bacterium]MCL6496729.1 hypothetical protein [Bacillota bacterium]
MARWCNAHELVAFHPDHATTYRAFESPEGLVIWFGFQSGQSLREHQTSSHAWIQPLQGRVRLEVGDGEGTTLKPGQAVALDPYEAHSVVALEPSILQVVLVPHPHRHTLLKPAPADADPERSEDHRSEPPERGGDDRGSS